MVWFVRDIGVILMFSVVLAESMVFLRYGCLALFSFTLEVAFE
jgi:hypothetical protein